MSNLLKVAAFSLAIIGAYTAFSVWYIPPMTPEPPPASEAAPAPKDIDGLIRLGTEVYNGRGACALCHDTAGGRAPVLDEIAVTGAERITDKRYKGAAKDAAGYIRESMAEPSAYVVAGYGVAGTNDAESPMPKVASPEVGLSAVDVEAVIAYLQDKAGVEVTVKPPEQGR